jgi:type VI secretion system secreted protein Hcp
MTSKFVKLALALLTLVLGAVVSPRSADAAVVDMFIRIDGIDGESADKGHEKWIQASNIHTGLSSTASLFSGGGGGTGKVKMNDLVFHHPIDKASAALAIHASEGRHIAKVTIEMRKAGGNATFYKITLSDVLVSSIAQNISGESLGEQVSLSFAKVEWEYRAQLPNGMMDSNVVKGGWDLKLNQKTTP